VAFKPIFKFRNPDSTADLNQAYSSAVSKGIYVGGDIIVTPSNLNVNIAPFTVVGHDGLVVVSDSTISLAARSDIGVNVIALFARYERNAEPVIKLEIFEESSLEGSPLKDFYVIFGTIDLSSPPMGGFVGLTYESTIVQPSNIGILTFNGSHYASKVGSSGLKAPVTSFGELPIFKNNSGDLRYVIADKALFAWDYDTKTWLNTIESQAANVSYAGGPDWRNGTTNPAIGLTGLLASGQITVITGANISDGEGFVLSDGTNPAVTFEFDSNASVVQSSTLRAVNFTGADSAVTVAATVIAAINNAPVLNLSASTGGGALVSLLNTNAGTAGNVTITDTVANTGFIVTGMAGGNDGDGIEGQVNKMITDLGSGAGTDKISQAGFSGTPNNIPAGTLSSALSGLLVSVNNRGRLTDSNNWLAANVFSNTVTITGVTTLNSQLVITAGGISVTGTATFASGLAVTGNLTTGSLSVTGTATFASGLAVTGNLTTTGNISSGGSLSSTSSTSVGTTLTVGGQSTFSNNIAITGTGTFSGIVSTPSVTTTAAPDNFYVDDALFTVDTLADTLPKGGGIGQYDEKLQDTLERIDSALVRKRAYTAVFTDGTTTTGGDHNGPFAIDVLALTSTYRAGNFFVRRGLHTFLQPSLTNNVTLMGEQAHDHVDGANQGYLSRISYSNGTSEFILGSRAKAASTFTNLAFEVITGKRFTSNPSFAYNNFQHCQFSLGSLRIQSRTILNDVIFDVNTGNTHPESLLIDPATIPYGIYLRHVRINNAPPSGIGTKAALRIGETSDDSPYEPIVIRDSLFANNTGTGYTLEVLNSKAPLIFDGCTFYGNNEVIAKISGQSQKVLFNNCTFRQDNNSGRVLEIIPISELVDKSEDIHFTNCKFIGCPAGGVAYTEDVVIKVGTVGATWASTFTDCIFQIRQGGIAGSDTYKITFTGNVFMQNCQVVLDTVSTLYGPILNFEGQLDGFIFNGNGYQYNGNTLTAPFSFDNDSSFAPKRSTISKLFLYNLKAPAVSDVVRLISLNSSHLTQSEISFSAIAASFGFTDGVIEMRGKSQISDCYFNNEIGAPINRWIFVDETAGRAIIENNFFDSSLEATISSDHGSEIATDSGVLGLLITGNVFEVAANANVSLTYPLIQITENSQSAIISNNYMVVSTSNVPIRFVDFESCNYVTIRDNLIKVSSSNPYAVIYGDFTTNKGLIENNQFINYYTRGGNGNRILGTAPNMRLRDNGAFVSTDDDGLRYLTITGATNAVNNGSFLIYSYVDADEIVFINPNGTPEDPLGGTWKIESKLNFFTGSDIIIRDNWGDIYAPKTYLHPLRPITMTGWSWDTHPQDGLTGISSGFIVLGLEPPVGTILSKVRIGVSTTANTANSLILQLFRKTKSKTFSEPLASITNSVSLHSALFDTAASADQLHILQVELHQTVKDNHTYTAHITRVAGVCTIHWLEVTIS
jgi:hypothetical protein